MAQTEPQFDRDAALITRAAAGDRHAFRQLYERHVGYVTHHVGRLVGPRGELEDVVQEVFVRVHRCLADYRGECAFTTWLYRVARNVAIDHLRRRKKTVSLDDWRPLRQTASAWRRLEARDQLRGLYAAMERMSLEHREAFVLYEIEGMKLREIADLTGDPLNTVASRVRRAREELRAVLEATQPGERA
ncbi:RNA polymerase subunit sigma-24 [Lujinxingia litoralis]|uniref:RNA polymerase subunit sigma-24 n=1 Tax=Lujinxingia litoralis TaxID=2211119 RepID=A0A328C2J6_9DELT|nr:sigma-70 family RNA polymerase sigma factor [Lujinxingia litoralis]RAL20927.1 RNA polymerase subunit sigma-24 [Lujinxingia litoralis]